VTRLVKIIELFFYSEGPHNTERWINPEHVVSLRESEEYTYVNLTDGSSYRVRGTAQDIMRLLRA
jgi:hypothetical protein